MVPSTAKAKALVQFDPNSIAQYNEKSTLSLACFDRCPLCPSRPEFAKDGVKLLPGNDARVNITFYKKTDKEPESRLVLTIKDLTLNDSGNYTCSSSITPKVVDDIYVTVKSKCAFMVVVLNLYCIKQTAMYKSPVQTCVICYTCMRGCP